MIELLKGWILNIVVVMILIIFVEIIIPSDKFKKYVKLVTGLVLMIVIINPIVTIMSKEHSLDKLAIQSFAVFDESQIERQKQKLDSLQDSQIISVYEEKLIEHIKNDILLISEMKEANVNVNLEKNVKSKAFGSILGIDAAIIDRNNNRANTNELIKEVSINVEKTKEQEQSQDTKLIKLIKTKLSETYKIPVDKINIKIQKEKE